MKRSLWLIFAALTLIAAGVLLQYQPDRLAVAAPADVQLPDVRIQHEFVEIPAAGVVSATPAPDRRAARTNSANPVGPDTNVAEPGGAIEVVPASHRTPGVRPANRDRTLFEKARRAFVGDGRHRPEPFPKVRDN